MRKLVFVVGCQRSGTTLLGQMLGAHPQAVLVDEPDGAYQAFDACLAGKPIEAAGIDWRAVLAKYRQPHRRAETSSNPVALLASVTHVVFKAPNLTHRSADIARLRSQACVVYGLRDPCSVVASMASLPFAQIVERQAELLVASPMLRDRFPNDIAALTDEERPWHVRRALVWKLKTALFSEFEEQELDPLLVRYEELVDAPELHAAKLAAHVGLLPAREMCMHQREMRGLGPGLTRRARAVDTHSRDTWRAWLTLDEAREVWECAAQTARRYGYEPPAAPTATVPEPRLPDLDSPIVLLGRGGSGTRLLAELAKLNGVFLGTTLNGACDSLEWVNAVYRLAAAALRRRGSTEPQRLDRRWSCRVLRECASDVLLRGQVPPGRPWGWKLPETMLIPEVVLEAFPNARVIHLVRHPITSSIRRSHLTSRPDNPVGRASLKRALRHAGMSPAEMSTAEPWLRNALTWAYQVETVQGTLQSLAPGRSLTVRYESLVDDIEQTAGAIALHLGVPMPLLPAPDPARNNGDAMENERADAVWQLCRRVAEPLGYTRSSPAGNAVQRTVEPAEPFQ